MQLIPIGRIVVPETRVRKHFDPAALEELTQDIVRNGLLQPIVVRQEGGAFFLAAGERRLRSLSDIFELGYELRCGGRDIERGLVPCLDVGELTPLQRLEIEYSENAMRRDFTWQENVAALASLKALRDAQAADAGQPPTSPADLALEVRGSAAGWSQDQTRKELIVSQHLDKPEVASAKSVDEAFKILKKQEAAARHAELAATVGAEVVAAAHRIYNAEAIEWLKACDPGQFDVILTDPPYSMGADSFGDSGGRAAGGHGYDDDEDVLVNLVNDDLFGHYFRVAKAQAHMYLFCDIDWFSFLRASAAAAGWRTHRTPFMWHKPTGSRMPWPHHGPQRRYEVILYAIKGDMPIQKIRGDVLEYSPDENLGHAAQKPVDLYVDLLSRSILPGMHILDTFGGTGTLIPAAHTMQCFATVVEKDPVSYGIAVKRIDRLGEDEL